MLQLQRGQHSCTTDCCVTALAEIINAIVSATTAATSLQPLLRMRISAVGSTCSMAAEVLCTGLITLQVPDAHLRSFQVYTCPARTSFCVISAICEDTVCLMQQALRKEITAAGPVST